MVASGEVPIDGHVHCHRQGGWRLSVCSLLQEARMAVDSARIGTRVFVVLGKHLGLTHL